MAPDRGDDVAVSAHENTLGQLTLTDQTQTTSTTTDSSNTIPAHLSHDPSNNAKRSDPFQFGQRHLSEQADVFEFNAWDHVTPDDEHLAFAEEQFAKQRAAPVGQYDYKRFNDAPEKWWDLFYKQKSATFFKDRKWLIQEFPVLGEVSRANAGKKIVLEVGAGAGNTAFPLMRLNENKALEMLAVDFSKQAVETMRNAEDYADIAEGKDGHCGNMRAEVWDAAGDELPPGIQEHSVDLVVMIFIFSALNPRQWQRAVYNVWHVLKPGGEVLFRDYGRGDLAQVRFKAGRWMEENFYVRGDGTRVYFFDKDELAEIWSGKHWTASCDQVRHNQDKHEESLVGAEGHVESVRRDTQLPETPFNIINLDVDRRLIVNRQRRLKMYRCWMQGRFQKPPETQIQAQSGVEELESFN